MANLDFLTNNPLLNRGGISQNDKDAVALALLARAVIEATQDDDQEPNKITLAENDKLTQFANHYIRTIVLTPTVPNFRQDNNLEKYTDLLLKRASEFSVNRTTFPADDTATKALLTQAKEAVEFTQKVETALKMVDSTIAKLRTETDFSKKTELVHQLSLQLSYASDLSEAHGNLHAPQPFLKQAILNASKKVSEKYEQIHLDGGTDENNQKYGLYKIYSDAEAKLLLIPEAKRNTELFNYFFCHLKEFKIRGADTPKSKEARKKEAAEIQRLRGELPALEDEVKNSKLATFRAQISVDRIRGASFVTKNNPIQRKLIETAENGYAIIDPSTLYQFFGQCSDDALLKEMEGIIKELRFSKYIPSIRKYVGTFRQLAKLVGMQTVAEYTLATNHEFNSLSKVDQWLSELDKTYLTPALKMLGFSGTTDPRLQSHLLYSLETQEQLTAKVDVNQFPDYLGYSHHIKTVLEMICFFLSDDDREIGFQAYTIDEISRDPDLRQFLSWNLRSWDPQNIPIPIFKIYNVKTGEVLAPLVIDLFKREDKQKNSPYQHSYLVPQKDGSGRLITFISLGLDPKLNKFSTDSQLSDFWHEAGHAINKIASFYASRDKKIFPEFRGPRTKDGNENLGRFFELLAYSRENAKNLIHVSTGKTASREIQEMWSRSPQATYGLFYNYKGFYREPLNRALFSLDLERLTDFQTEQIKSILFFGSFAVTQKGDGYTSLSATIYGKALLKAKELIEERFPGLPGKKLARNLIFKYILSSHQGDLFATSYQNFLRELQRIGIDISSLPR